ncbi:hypothetical protein ACHAXA_001202 [Cyclostephanos tholiformis]|uniref:PDZ domain-containing protein n=1 Tax=Cyclostephanos tholiformis TaxID=382380 RepID=A0ABD3SQ20_9STRA
MTMGFLKLFRRNKKTKDPAEAGILSASSATSAFHHNNGQHGSMTGGGRQKKLSKRQLKKQMKKDRLAHFPSSEERSSKGGLSGGGGGMGAWAQQQPPQSQADYYSIVGGRGGGSGVGGASSSSPPPPTAWDVAEDQKENKGSIAALPAFFSSSFTSSNSSSGGLKTAGGKRLAPMSHQSASDVQHHHLYKQQQQQDVASSFDAASSGFYEDVDLYAKPALSMIAEERSPRNAVSPGGQSSTSTSPEANGGGGGFGSFPSSGETTNGGHPIDEYDDQPPSLSVRANNGGGNRIGGGVEDQSSTTTTTLASSSVISPSMSGNKPPLTPNRHGGGGGAIGYGGSVGQVSSPSHFRNAHHHHGMTVDTASPNSYRQQDGSRLSLGSPDPDDAASLRGMRIAGSEEMCLSVDDEDDEYNRLIAGGGRAGNCGAASGNANGGGSSGSNKVVGGGTEEKFVSALDRSPFGYTASDDDDNALFPALVEDKDPWNHHTQNANGPNKAGILPMANETQEDMRAWTPSPTKKGSSFTFQGDPVMMNSGAQGENKQEIQGQANKVLFENFADFEPFIPSSSHRLFHAPKTAGSSSGGGGNGSSKSVAHNSSPVSALLEDWRARKSGHRSNDGSAIGFLSRTSGGIGGSSSFNSAPVLTPSNIRGQVNSARLQETGGPSISRVIDNLELHVNKRLGGGGGAPPAARSSTGGGGHGSHSSVNSHSQQSHRSDRIEIGSASAIREAKERIRRENLMNNESKMIDMLATGDVVGVNNATNKKDNWLFDEVAGTLGPRSVAADLESLGGRSGKSRNSLGGKSHRSGKSHKSRKSRSGASGHHTSRRAHRDEGDDGSRTSRNSRNSYRSYQTTKSMVSQMSEQSRSVANDLLRLEAQLSMVGKSRNIGGSAAAGVGGSSNGSVSGAAPSASTVVSRTESNKRRDDCGMTVTSNFTIHNGKSSSSRSGGAREHISASARRAAARTLLSKATVVAPPGKLGIILANRTDLRGTVVSGVRTSSVLADKVSPGDRIIAIDGEDVSQMNVKEITTIMARKSEFERVLVLLATPKVQYD